MRFAMTSLLVLLVVVVGVSLIAMGIAKFGKGVGRKITGGKTALFARVYFCLLLIALAAYVFMVVLDSDIPKEIAENHQYGEYYHEYYDFQEIIERDALDTTEGVIKESDWEFELQTDRLAIESLAMYEIFVEIVPNQGSTVKVSSYKTRSTMAGTDITDRILPPNIEIIKNELLNDILLIDKEPDMIEGLGFVNSFVESQFMKNQGNRFGESISNYVDIGQHIIYIRVPESITLDDPSGMLNQLYRLDH